MASRGHGIHSLEEFVPKGSDCFQQTLGRENTTHSKRKEYGKIKISPSKEYPLNNDEYEDLNS